MLGLTERSLKLFPLTHPSSSRPVIPIEQGEPSTRRAPIEVVVSSVDSEDVESVVRSLESNKESVTFEADDEEIPIDSDEEAWQNYICPPMRPLAMLQ